MKPSGEREELSAPTNIFRFWRPLLITWLFMSLELAFLAAFIARMPDQKANLAAFGLCLSLLLTFESPLLSIVSAAVALICDRKSYRLLLQYTAASGLLMSVLLFLLLLPENFDTVVVGWMGIEPRIAALVNRAGYFMIFCPFTVGYRRLYQGVLVRAGRTPLVSLGTALRLLTLGLSCFFARDVLHYDGAVIGGFALGIGMFVEAVYARLACHRYLDKLPADADPPGVRNIGAVNRFYLPLAASTMIGLSIQPVLSAFIAHSPQPIESLAVIPVINSLVILFRSVGFSYQEVVIALLSQATSNRDRLRAFGGKAALICGVLFAATAFSPALPWIFINAGGLSSELAQFAVTPTRVLTGVPIFGVLLFLMRGEVIFLRRTGLITASCIADVAGALAVMLLNVFVLKLPGAIAASIAGSVGIAGATLVLFRSHWVKHSAGPSAAEVAQHTTPPPLEIVSE